MIRQEVIKASVIFETLSPSFASLPRRFWEKRFTFPSKLKISPTKTPKAIDRIRIRIFVVWIAPWTPIITVQTPRALRILLEISLGIPFFTRRPTHVAMIIAMVLTITANIILSREYLSAKIFRIIIQLLSRFIWLFYSFYYHKISCFICTRYIYVHKTELLDDIMWIKDNTLTDKPLIN